MPSPIAHTLAGCCVAVAARRFPTARTPWFAAAVILAANLSDIDLLPALAGGIRSVPRLHQGFTHSFAFAFLAALPATLLLRGRLRFPAAYGLFALAGATHPFLDYLALDIWPPIGVPLFWPLTETRFHSPVSIFPAVAKSSLSRIFSLRNLRSAIIETAWFLPFLWMLLRRVSRPAAVAPAGATRETPGAQP